MKRHSGPWVSLWSEFTHAKGDCKWLSPLRRAPHAPKPEGFHRRPAEGGAGTASMTSNVSRQLPRRRGTVCFGSFQKSQVRKGPQPAGGPLWTKVITLNFRWRRKKKGFSSPIDKAHLKYHQLYHPDNRSIRSPLMLLLFYAVVLMIPMKILKDYWKKKMHSHNLDGWSRPLY